ncbi:flippase [bacterium]|nr:flippase [bacterium]
MVSDRMVIARNTTLLVSAEVVTRALGALLTILIARRLGAEKLGLLAFALSFTELFGFITRFGFRTMIARDLAKHPERTGPVLGGLLVLETLLGAAVLAAVWITLLLMGTGPEKSAVVLICAGILVFSSILDIFYAIYRAHQNAVHEVFNKIGLNLSVSITGVAVIWMGYGLLPMLAVRLALYAVFFAAGIRILVRRYSQPVFTGQTAFYAGLFRSALPFAALGIIVTVNTQIGTILLTFFKGESETGYFSAALRICGVLTFLPMAFTSAVLPAMAKFRESGDDASFRLSYEKSLKFLFILVIPIAVSFSVLAGPIIRLLYGSSFGQSVPMLRILLWMLVFAFLNQAFMIAFSAMDRESIFVRFQAFGTAFNVVLGLLLIPATGGIGLCAASAGSQALITLLSAGALTSRIPGVHPVRILAKAMICAGILGAALLPFRHQSPAVLLPAYGLAYVSMLFAIRTFGKGEIRMFRELLSRRGNTA